MTFRKDIVVPSSSGSSTRYDLSGTSVVRMYQLTQRYVTDTRMRDFRRPPQCT